MFYLKINKNVNKSLIINFKKGIDFTINKKYHQHK